MARAASTKKADKGNVLVPDSNFIVQTRMGAYRALVICPKNMHKQLAYSKVIDVKSTGKTGFEGDCSRATLLGERIMCQTNSNERVEFQHFVIFLDNDLAIKFSKLQNRLNLNNEE